MQTYTYQQYFTIYVYNNSCVHPVTGHYSSILKAPS